MAKNRGGRGGGQVSRGNMNNNRNRQGRMTNRKPQSQQYRLQVSSKRATIEKNLQNLQKNLVKKKIAQARYYNTGRSAIKREEGGGPSRPNKRPASSIHNRLGANSGPQPKRKTNTRVFNNRNNQQNGVLTKKYQRLNRQFTVQNRLQQVRQQAPKANQSFNQGRPNVVRKQIKLQRKNRLPPPQPTNVTIKVENRGAASSSLKHSVSAELNPRLQAEIRMIQSNTAFKDPIPSIPIHPQGAGVTKSTLNERFSQL